MKLLINLYVIREVNVSCLLGIQESIEKMIYAKERWPIICDSSGMANRFLKYQRGAFIHCKDVERMTKDHLRRGLVGGLRYGNLLTIAFEEMDDVIELESFVDEAFFPSSALSRFGVFEKECWGPLLRQSEGDPEDFEFVPRDEFALILTTTSPSIPPPLRGVFGQVTVEEVAEESEDSGMGAIEEMMGVKEVKRNSKEMVEDAFDGELESVRLWVMKGFLFLNINMCL